MGDVAKVRKEWTNTEIGVGYAAPFVRRQKGPGSSETVKIVDMTKSLKDDRDDEEEDAEEKKQERENKGKKHKKHKKGTRGGEDPSVLEVDNYNPFLQELATRLSNKTRVFTFTNE